MRLQYQTHAPRSANWKPINYAARLIAKQSKLIPPLCTEFPSMPGSARARERLTIYCKFDI